MTGRKARELFSLRIGCALSIVFFSAFWALDWYAMREHVALSGALRAFCAAFSSMLLLLTYRRRRFIARHVYLASASLALCLIGSISIMCWVKGGLNSPYYAGINTVLIVVGMMFSWTVPQAVAFHCIGYAAYMVPNLFFATGSVDIASVLCNQFFLVTTIFLTAISQARRVQLENRDRMQRRQQKKLLVDIKRVATRDPLTGILNRGHLLSLGEREYSRCKRHARNFSALVIDIDWFKKINDGYSHQVGDLVIQSLAQILGKCTRSIDVVGRYGGEEFVVFLPEADVRQAIEIVARRIQLTVRETQISTPKGALQFTLSMGVAQADGTEKDLADLIHRADLALYESKHGGRDQVRPWFPKDTKVA